MNNFQNSISWTYLLSASGLSGKLLACSSGLIGNWYGMVGVLAVVDETSVCVFVFINYWIIIQGLKSNGIDK